jgi:hypothetical protein
VHGWFRHDEKQQGKQTQGLKRLRENAGFEKKAALSG